MKERRADTEPLISVVIPVYNAEPYLRECLDSVLAQTYRQIEVILVEDGSADQSGSICAEYAGEDPRVQVIYLEKNRGVSHARNKGIQRAAGDYIIFVDSDDYIERNMLEKLHKNLVENCADISICGMALTGFGPWTEKRKEGEACVLSGEQAISCMLRRQPFGWEMCDKLFAAEPVRRCHFHEKISRGEDLLFQYQVLQKVQRVSYFPDQLYHYVCREGSAMQEGFKKSQYSEFLVYQYLHGEMFKRDPEVLPVLEQKILNINVRLAVKAVESRSLKGRALYCYLCRFRSNVRKYFNREALALFGHKKIAAETVLLYISTGAFLTVLLVYKGMKGLLVKCGWRRA